MSIIAGPDTATSRGRTVILSGVPISVAQPSPSGVTVPAQTTETSMPQEQELAMGNIISQLESKLQRAIQQNEKVRRLVRSYRVLPNALIIETPEGTLVFTFIGNMPEIKYRLRNVNDIIYKLRSLYQMIENKIYRGEASPTDLMLYMFLRELFLHYTPLGEILITPNLLKTVSRISGTLPLHELGDVFAPPVITIGSSIMRIIPIYSAILE